MIQRVTGGPASAPSRLALALGRQSNMKRTKLILLTILCLLIAAIFIVPRGLKWYVQRGIVYEVDSVINSPNNQYAATIWGYSNTMGPSSCFTVVSINPVYEPFSLEDEKNIEKYIVFHQSGCSPIRLQWRENSIVEINISNLSKSVLGSSYLENIDATNTVNIEYCGLTSRCS